MFKTIGTVLAILAIASVVIAWSTAPGRKPGTAPTINPYELQRSAPPLPNQDFTDYSFVF